MAEDGHRAMDKLQAGLAAIRESPKDGGVVAMIVRRPQKNERETLGTCELDPIRGLVGDTWSAGRNPDADAQLTVMNSRAIALIAQDRGRWPLAGDQLYLDLDLSTDNLPPGTQIALGSAIIEVSLQPHTGCRKFAARFGSDALQFVNSEIGKQLRLRGINARIRRGGVIRLGDVARKCPPPRPSPSSP